MKAVQDNMRETIAQKIAVNPKIKIAHLATSLGCSEVEVLRAWPNDEVCELDARRAEEIIRALEKLDVVYVVVKNASCVSETFGIFGGFSRSGPFLNVATESLHLHLRVEKIATIFALVPQNGGMPSLQFFDSEEASCFKVFLIQKENHQPLAEESEYSQQFDMVVFEYRST